MQTSGLKYQPHTRRIDQPHCGGLGTGTEGKSFLIHLILFVLLMKYLNSRNCHQILDQYVSYYFMCTAFKLIVHIWGRYYWQYLDVLHMAYYNNYSSFYPCCRVWPNWQVSSLYSTGQHSDSTVSYLYAGNAISPLGHSTSCYYRFFLISLIAQLKSRKVFWSIAPYFYSHSYRASWYCQSFIYSPTDALVSCLKKQYSQTSVHERLGSWTIRFTNKFSEHKTSRMTYYVSSYEHASHQKTEKRKRIPFQTITFHFLTTFHLRRQLSSIQVR